MSYIRPSVLVYQDLLNAGGVLNSVPDLEACIIGPAYNKLEYVPNSLASKVSTSVMSSVSTTGTAVASTSSITVVSTGGFNVDDAILILGAGTGGVTLQAKITDITGNVISLDTAIVTSVADAKVTKSGSLDNITVANSFEVPGAKPGQTVDQSSVKIWLDEVKVETFVTRVGADEADLTGPVLTITSGSTTLSQSTTSGGLRVQLTDLTFPLFVGDQISIAGAGENGANHIATVTSISGTDVHFTPATITTTSAHAVVSKYTPANLNSTTNTLNAEVGDEVVLSYTNTNSEASTFTSSIRSITTSSGQNGIISTIVLTDSIPNDYFTSSTAYSIMSVRKVLSDKLLPAVRPISGGANYTLTDITTLGTFEISSYPELVYGPILSGNVYISYRALRADISNQILTINDINDLKGQLGDLTGDNPLGLGCQIALANTVTQVKAIAVASDDLTGYLAALEIAEGSRVYALTPLTQNIAILNAFKAHVEQMSTPENHSWRVAIVNTAMPTVQYIGPYSADYANTNNDTIEIVNLNNVYGSSDPAIYAIQSSNSTFVSDGVIPGDTAVVDGVEYTVLSVVSNQQIVIDAEATATAVSYYITRNISKTQIAELVAATSESFGSNRVWHIQPDTVGVTINGVIEYLPGYYLCCGLAGMVAGFPVQQGFTNIGVAGISDLKNSNFYFSKSAINTMVASGTDIFIQDVQGGIPYCLHELTTDVSVLQYREQLVVKNWDFLSYYYFDKLKGFIGSWNITPDTINIIKQTLIASSELIKSKKLPRIGPPLLSYDVISLEQDVYNKDNLNVYMNVGVVYPLNNLNLHLVL